MVAAFDIFGQIQQFLEKGGPVLNAIMVITFFMWALIVERFIYFGVFHKRIVADALNHWNARSDRKSWHARHIRMQLISEVRENTVMGLGFIATLVALCPMFGLLGTVTGMVEVFDVMAITGSSNPRAMAGGVSKATIPTMSGMVAALSGLYFSFRLARKAQTEVLEVADALEIDH
ncbi:MAG: MotA/TolQ/ExbB proton channel family protein [Rhodospirillaceae bacterium]